MSATEDHTDETETPGGSWEKDQPAPRKAKAAKRAQPHKPEGVKQPQDHKSPAQKEAEGIDEASVEYRGVTFTFPADSDDWPAFATLAFEQNLATAGVQRLVSAAEFQEYLKLDPAPTNRDTRTVFELIQAEMGLGSGN
ncbi:hypothetical protein ACHIPZ_13870 [Antrihabitans sp. NCIMB 15449]|uniref:Uncharacterized protein n=1 Tax=Antrihabitans spumae TaxID=3373370 RepID=A0ABW7JND3_9NOCA